MKISQWAIALLASSAAAITNNSCVDGLHMIVARGTLEPPGEGSLGLVAGLVMDQLSNASNSAGVRYPAGLNPYTGSVVKGTKAVKHMIKHYEKHCPNTKIALLGYSQGAQIIGNALCGTSSKPWNHTKPMNKKYADNIIAVAMTGDPTFIPHLSYDRGTSTKHGKFPRRDIKACHPYAQRMASWCDKNDIYCASGHSLAVHLNYTYRYADEIAKFIVDSYMNPAPLNAFGGKHNASHTHPQPTHHKSSSPHSEKTQATSSQSGSSGSPHKGGGSSPKSAGGRNYEPKAIYSFIGVILAVAGLS